MAVSPDTSSHRAVPMLQVALDFVSLPLALAMALKVVDEVDIIEIGTPLCKSAGVEAIRSIREVCPGKIIQADFKTPDVGGLEARLAFDAGADIMSVIGGAPLATIRAALEVARRRDKDIQMEMTGVRDIFARAQEWRRIGVNWLVYHRGWDEEAADREWSEQDRETIRRLLDLGFRMTITGGLTVDSLPFFRDLPISVVIAGRAIHQANDPAAAANELRSTIGRLWRDYSKSKV